MRRPLSGCVWQLSFWRWIAQREHRRGARAASWRALLLSVWED